MNAIETLAPVINIDEEKCVNCYACIDACPVKYCMDGSGEKLSINHNLCIGCGNCIAVCTHKARRIIDDTERFFADIKQGVKMIAVAAPAVASVFPGLYLKLNGYLKSLGASAVFDVSFGAELTVVSYLNHIKAKNPKMVIAQPCPAIVSYLEIYQSELLPFLAPAESPMLHSIKMIREYYPEYAHHKIAVISPCAAKKREFDETGLGDYNVTMLALKRTLEEQRVELSGYPAVDYAGKSAERAVTFSSPGGLLDTAERFVPGIRRNTRKIEGVNTVYHYLKEISGLLNNQDIQLPLLVDCLNCEKGCNGGPGTGNGEKALEAIESPVRKRSASLESALNPQQREKRYKEYHKLLNQYWKPGLYDRKYRDLSGNFTLKQPDEKELEEVFRGMKKLREEDMYDCTSCGYGTCRAMAVAIFNGLNKPSNCAHYNIGLLEEEQKKSAELNGQIKAHIQGTLEVIESINRLLEKLNSNIKTQVDSATESSDVTGKMVSALLATSELSRQKRESVMTLIENTAKGQDAMKATVESVQGISESIDGIASAIKIISVIAANTNLLSMNAAIEAAHAGDAGKGFAVVADEIRHLSESTRENSRNISQTLSNIIAGITDTSKRSIDTGNLIDEMSSEINGFAGTMTELIDTLARLSSESSSITGSLKNLREQSEVVKTDYAEMMALTDKLLSDINYLATM